MAFTNYDLCQEIARRAVLNQSGTEFTTAIQNAVNLSMWRIARDAKWRTLRRSAAFNTITTYFNGVGPTMTINAMNSLNYANSTVAWPTGKGPAACSFNSNVFTINGATLISDGIQVGRWGGRRGEAVIDKGPHRAAAQDGDSLRAGHIGKHDAGDAPVGRGIDIQRPRLRRCDIHD